MDIFNPFLVKTYQEILKKTPSSKVFHPLAQIYRLKKELSKAKQICLKGIVYNPSYAAGYITLAQIYGEENNITEALSVLNRARSLSPENPKVYQIFGELHQKENNIEKTLQAFKMVLFLRPGDQTARKIVQQLEKTLFGRSAYGADKAQKATAKALQNTKLKPHSEVKTLARRRKLQKLQKLLSLIEKREAFIG